MQLLWLESRKSPTPVKWALENTKIPWGGLRSGYTHTHTHTHTDEPVASPATGTLILSQSNNAAAGTNRELFNSHQLMLCHQVLLCAFPILILCISRISFAFIFIAQMLKNRRRGGAGYHKRWYLGLAPEMGQRERCDIVLSHTAKTDRYPDILLPLSISLFVHTETHLCSACYVCICMYCTYFWVFACTHADADTTGYLHLRECVFPSVSQYLCGL